MEDAKRISTEDAKISKLRWPEAGSSNSREAALAHDPGQSPISLHPAKINLHEQDDHFQPGSSAVAVADQHYCHRG
jgi:hypothetical protein